MDRKVNILVRGSSLRVIRCATYMATGVASISGSTAVPLATVRATQAVSTTTVERGSRNVDADTGSYSLSLVTGAPEFVAYDPAATVLNFTADVGTPGQFRLTAAAEGFAPLTADINVTDGDVDTPFAFAP